MDCVIQALKPEILVADITALFKPEISVKYTEYYSV
jgi:hypothetical protein